jgi:hypothetical protein
MDSNFNEKILDRIYRINMIFLCSDHFPEESDPTQSAYSGKKLSYNLQLASMDFWLYFIILNIDNTYFAGGD